MDEQRRKDRFLREMNEAPFYSLSRLNYFIHKNPMLFTSVFLETNLLFLSYPLQTMKTRVQSRHVKFDLCHYSKNAVEKARTPRLTSHAQRHRLRLPPDPRRERLPPLHHQVLRLLPPQAQVQRVLPRAQAALLHRYAFLQLLPFADPA